MRVPVDLPAGLVSDNTPFSTQQSYRTGDKVRFVKGKAEVMKGWQSISTTNFIPGACRTIQPWKDNAGASLIAYGSHQGLYVLRSGRFADITPANLTAGNIDGLIGPGFGYGGFGKGAFGLSATPGAYGARTWSLSNFGQALVANPRSGPVYMWSNNLSNAAVQIANAPVNVSYALVSQTRRQILAFGANQQADGVFNPSLFRCSDVDGNYTTWNVTTSNLADELPIGQGAPLIAARIWGDNLAVWSSDSLYTGVFVASNTQAWRFDHVEGGVGLVGPNAAVIIGQTAYWISPDLQLYACVAGGAPVQVACPIREDSIVNVAKGQGDKIVLSYLTAPNELRIDYPDVRDSADPVNKPNLENSRFIAMHLDDGAWSRGTQCRTAFDRGSPLQFPVGVETVTLSLPYPGTISDNASAANALAVAQKAIPAISGTNLATMANTAASNASVTSILTGQSGWGVRFNGNTAAESLTISGLGITTGQVASISYRAQVVVGPSVNATVTYGTGLIANASLTTAVKTFTHTNVPVTANGTTFSLAFPAGRLANGTVIEVTDLKVEAGATATGWAPSPLEPTLYATYTPFILAQKYPQLVGKHYYHELGNSADGQSFDWSIETNDFALDANQTAMMIRRFIPDFRDQLGNVNLTIFTRMSPQDQTEQVFGPYLITPGLDRIDMRITGKIARFRIDGNGEQTYLRLGKSIFDAVATATR